MPLELQIIRPPDFIRMGSLGALDWDSTKDALRMLAYACRKRGIFRAMLDLRELSIPSVPIFTTSEIAALVGTFREAGFTTRQRLAVLYRTDPHHGARMFAFISTLKGWKVRSFEEFEKALAWLQEDEDKALVKRADAIQIPFAGEE
jgi:hypothetical protein